MCWKETIEEAQAQARDHAGRVLVPNLRYRRDIGDRLIGADYDRLDRLGMFDPVPAELPHQTFGEPP